MSYSGTRRALLASGIKPAYFENFLAENALSGNISFSRSSSATVFNASGALVSVANNIPRFDHDSSGNPLGLLIEEARTNVVLYCRDLTNAAWSAANITAVKNQTGIDGSSNSASSITASAANGTILQSVTLASSARAQSAYVKRLAGTGEIDMTMDGGTTWTAITSALSTSAWTRASIPTQTLANPSIGFRIVTSGDAIVVDAVQNENGTFATSAILTTSAAAARAADVARLVGTAGIALAGTTGTMIAEVSGVSNPSAYPRVIGSSTVGSPDDFVEIGPARAATWNGTNYLQSSNTLVPANVNRIGVAWSPTGRSISLDGGSVASDAYLLYVPPNYMLGYGNSSYLNAHIAGLSIYNKRLPDSVLQSKTIAGSPFQ